MQSRSPKRVAPRVVNSPTLLAGVVRCGYCGAALIQNTGKGGLFAITAAHGNLKKERRLAGACACRWSGSTRSSSTK